MGAATFTRALGTGGVQVDGETFDATYKTNRVVRGLLTFSASYATGGDTLDLATVGLKELKRILIDPSIGQNTSGLSIAAVVTNPAAPLIQAFETNDTQVANATNLSARRPIPVWLMGVG